MDLIFLIQLAKSVFKELCKYRYTAILIGCLVAFAILAAGVLWQEKYAVSASLYADRQNIIQPLLAGNAQVTKVEDQREVVKDIMLSRRILEKIVDSKEYLGVDSGDLDDVQQGAQVSRLRNSIDVKRLGKSYIGVSYSDVDPGRSFYVVTKLVEYFIKESSDTKRSESKQAFQFIDKQANQYKDQLRDAENKLKLFQSSNTDGNAARIERNVEDFSSEISTIELDLEQSNVRIESLQTQVNQEDRFLSQKAKASGYQERIATAVAELDILRLSLTDNHPDIISLVQHIDSLRIAASGEGTAPSSSIVSIENPVYDELRGQLASATVERNAIQKRLSSLKKRLVEARAKSKRVVERNAELAELTRDYDVTQKLYEELLESKEKARLSMTLDIEEQGVSYKIQEPAKFPLGPSGLRYVHFVVLGLLLGIVVPLGLMVVYVLADPRIRFSSSLEHDLGVPLLVDIPHLQTSSMLYVRRMQLRSFAVVFFVCVGLYVGAAVLFKLTGLS